MYNYYDDFKSRRKNKRYNAPEEASILKSQESNENILTNHPTINNKNIGFTSTSLGDIRAQKSNFNINVSLIALKTIQSKLDSYTYLELQLN